MKKVFKVFGTIFITIIIILGGLTLNGSCFKVYKNTDLNKGWMSHIKDDALLNDVVIPGTHDAGTNKMLYLGECQQFSVEEQLEAGVRYFDLRVRNKDDKFVMYHSILNGVDFEGVISSISTFIKENETETLLLDFQHFDNAQEHVFNKVNEYLNGFLVKNETDKSDLEFVSTLTMKDVRGKCLCFFGENSSFTSYNYIFARNNDECSKKEQSMDSCYYTERNTKSSKTYISESLPYYVSRIKEKINNEGYKGIFVLQGQLTDGIFVFGPWFRERHHNKNMSKYINELPDQDYFHLINVIMRDFVDENKAREIIDLNKFKGIYN